tara:strand:- start:118 stop:1332 length:1215 start_codon:yes stop_codon:yes gene_type:complete
MLERVGSYYYIFPTYKQGRNIIWDGADKAGFRFLDHFPAPLIKRKNSQEMVIELINGSIFKIVGSDNMDRIVGTNPIGCVYSEYSVSDPMSWDYIKPILDENGGWAIFNFTPRGKNHAYKLLNMARASDEWFVSTLTVTDTRAIRTKVLSETKRELYARYGDNSFYRQEYEVSFEGSLSGAYYSHLIEAAKEDGRIESIDYDPEYPVHTAWDIGLDDMTAIWFYQIIDREIRIIDYHEGNNKSLQYFARDIRNKPYLYGTHWLPHDIKQREYTTGQTRLATAKKLLGKCDVVPRISVADGIEAARNLLSKCAFDGEKCQRGLDALSQYYKEYDEKNQTFKEKPKHDWTSHASDAFRYLALTVVNRKTIQKHLASKFYNPNNQNLRKSYNKTVNRSKLNTFFQGM